ncbi:CDGSH iron-sulfur domain-containing protein [Gulosibacter sediminis]|uniref:CDGSH iron-sulfur domain-containing protein n=1 Tax=Gulosibacter sediminis TaxID=1729695 RepID=UPI0031F665CB
MDGRPHPRKLVEWAVFSSGPEGSVSEKEPVSVTPYPDGPLLMRGDFELRTTDGEPIERKRRTVALCRCGLSSIKPFCDGTHKAAGFRTDD